MSRIIEILDDYRPLMDAVNTDPEVRDRYRGTELFDCPGDGCTRAVLAWGPRDATLMLELVDDAGWNYLDGAHLCPEHWRATGL